MDFKVRLIHSLIQVIQKELDLFYRAANEARIAATHAESRQEGKYDTRGLEASYLAGAQARRADELSDLIARLQNLKPLPLNEDSEIQSTALVEIVANKEALSIFLVPFGGGRKIEIDERSIQTIGTQSPLGQELLGRLVGDEFEFEIKGSRRPIKILSLN